MKSNEGDYILGCYVAGPSRYYDADPETVKALEEKGELFRSYIWGEFGISEPLKTLKRREYGKDLDLALFRFHLLPLIEELIVLKEIERFRKKEKAIGIPIIIHDENFFNKSDLERRRFLKNAILEKLGLLDVVVKRNKLDTNIELLKSDAEEVLF